MWFIVHPGSFKDMLGYMARGGENKQENNAKDNQNLIILSVKTSFFSPFPNLGQL